MRLPFPSLSANFETLDRDKNSYITQGRAICRLVSLYDTIDEMVDENDRREALEADGETDGRHTLEYVITFDISHLIICSI